MKKIFVYYQPKTLFETYREFLLSKKYPKEYLAAPICDTGHLRSVKEWEESSPVPINLSIPFLEDEHIIFNYPEISDERNQIEMRTFDYTHILNNLHFHVCNKGIQGALNNERRNWVYEQNLLGMAKLIKLFTVGKKWWRKTVSRQLIPCQSISSFP